MKKHLSNEEQIKIINRVLSKSEKFPDYRFKSGRYANRTLEYVAKNDLRYLKYLTTLPEKMVSEKVCAMFYEAIDVVESER